MELPEPEENGPTPPQTTKENRAKEERLQKAQREVEEAAGENADSCSDAESDTAPSHRGSELHRLKSSRGSELHRLKTLNLEPGPRTTPRTVKADPRMVLEAPYGCTAEQFRAAEKILMAYPGARTFSSSACQTSRLPLTPEDRELEIEVENLREQVSQLTQEKLDLIKEAEALRAFKQKRSRPGKSQREGKNKQLEEPPPLHREDKVDAGPEDLREEGTN